MSLITQLSQTDPNFAWIVGALPLAVALDLAVGDLPGRSLPARGLGWLIEVVDGGVAQLVTRVGGGRGAELSGGLVATTMVAGSAAGLTWLAVDLADTIGGPATLAVRTALIAAGIAIRSTGDRILHAAEAPDRATAARWLDSLGGQASRQLERGRVPDVCVATVGEMTLARLVAPLGWLAIGGPAAMWGYLALRSLREVQLRRGDRDNLMTRIPVILADLAEWPAAVATWLLICVAAALIRADPVGAFRDGWRTIRAYPRSGFLWAQATLAGALGIRIVGGRDAGVTVGLNLRLGSADRPGDQSAVALAVRLMQVTALLAAGLTSVVTLFWT